MSAVGSVDVDGVTALVEHVAREVVAPRFRDLGQGDVREKAPGDLVTVVDTEAERVLTAGLAEVAPGVPVVGEEATAADPTVLDRLHAPLCLVVDPIDGTQAFVDGEPDYAVMVGLLDHGDAVAGWICLPETEETFVAERGAGARLNGRALMAPPPSEPGALRGHVAVRYLPDDVRSHVVANAPALGSGVVVGDRGWSGRGYADLATGRRDVMVFWRTSPWDHAPGTAVLRELGGRVARFDGTPYRPADPGSGLVSARDDVADRAVRGAFALGR